MENEIFLKQMQNYYESLKFFSISDGKLILHSDIDYKIHLDYTNLSSLNPNLFLLSPIDIFHIIYMLELLHNQNLKENEIAFIQSYANKYLKLNDLAIENNGVDGNLVWCFSIPIYSSYDPEFLNNPCSSIIQKIINSHSENLENGRDNHPRLVLTNPKFQVNEDQNVEKFEKAGFTTLFLIAGAITITCLYIIYFVINH